MSIYLLILAVVGTIFSVIMGIFVHRQVYKSRWIDSRAITIFWIFLSIIVMLIIALWALYFMSLQTV